MRDVYLVRYTVGNDWVTGVNSPQQPDYRAHADYLNEVDKTNRLVIGGPLEGFSRVHLAMEASSADEVRGLLRNDPWHQKDMLRIEEVTKWLLLVDPRNP